MPVVSQAHRLIYFEAPATGCTAVEKALVHHEVGDVLLSKNVVVDGKVLIRAKHSSYADIYRFGLVTERMERYLRVCNVRNVFALYVAKYLRYQTKRRVQAEDEDSYINKLPKAARRRELENIDRALNGTFEDYLTDFLGERAPFDPHRRYHRPCHVFLHQEVLSDDFAWLCERLPLPIDSALEQRNVTGAMPEGKTYHDYYTDALRRRVEAQNAPFFARFPEYAFDGLDEEMVVARRPNLKGLQVSLMTWRPTPQDDTPGDGSADEASD